MKGYRFYAEYKSPKAKRIGGPAPENVIAVFLDGRHPIGFWSGDSYLYECMSAVFFEANSGVCSGSVHTEYLRERCKRISEAKARQIHPKMFIVLDHYAGINGN